MAEYFTTVPVLPVVLYQALAEKLSEHRYLVRAREALSHSMTAILLLISLAGFYQLGSIASEVINTPQAASSAVVSTATPKAVSAPKPAGLAKSVPTHVSIPAIGVDANTVSVGQNSDGTMEVPGPYDIGWYNLGPSPGEVGPAVMVGHVDYVTVGAAVFWHLRDMQPGQIITINREDGSAVNFVVQKVQSYDQGNFPTNDVYGNLTYPGLRLITCDGDFNYATHHYSNNLVVYAKAQL